MQPDFNNLPVFCVRDYELANSQSDCSEYKELLLCKKIVFIIYGEDDNLSESHKKALSVIRKSNLDLSKVVTIRLSSDILERIDTKNKTSLLDLSLYHMYYDILPTDTALKKINWTHISWCYGFNPNKMEDQIVHAKKNGTDQMKEHCGNSSLPGLEVLLKADAIRKLERAT